MIFFLYGPDTYRSHKKLQAIKNQFLTHIDRSALNLTILDGAKLKFEDLHAAVATPPLLARQRLVIIKDLLKQKPNPDFNVQLLALLDKESLLAEIQLVFLETEKVDQRTAVFRRLSREKGAERFELLSESELRLWLRTEVKKRGGQISPAAAEKLVELVGNDLWQLDSELNKLLSYGHDRTIEPADVLVLVSGKFDDDIFKFVDTIGAKNRQLAHRLLSEQLASGADELYLLSMLLRQFRLLLQIKDLSAGQSDSGRELASQLSLPPFVVNKLFRQSQNFTQEKLRWIYRQLLAIDVKIKTGYASPAALFDILLVKIMA